MIFKGQKKPQSLTPAQQAVFKSMARKKIWTRPDHEKFRELFKQAEAEDQRNSAAQKLKAAPWVYWDNPLWQ